MNDKDKSDIIRDLESFIPDVCITKNCETRYEKLIAKVRASLCKETMKQVLFKETEPESLWSIFVDGELIEANLRNDEKNIADSSLDALWKALDVELKFENHPDG